MASTYKHMESIGERYSKAHGWHWACVGPHQYCIGRRKWLVARSQCLVTTLGTCTEKCIIVDSLCTKAKWGHLVEESV